MPANGILNMTASDIARMLAGGQSVEIQTSAKYMLMSEMEKHKLELKWGFTGLIFAPTANGWRVTPQREKVK